MAKGAQGAATILKLGPTDHGRELSWEEFERAHYREGFYYELIGGKLYVSPLPNPLHECLVQWLETLLKNYAQAMQAILNYVSIQARVFVPGEEEKTSPEPDLAAYQDYPFHLPKRQRNWRQIDSLLVAEIISEDDPDKDLIRNVALYEKVQSIREYWIIDPRTDPDYPDLLVYRRRGQRWQRPIRIAGGDTYTTKLLPGFSLVLDASNA